MKSIFFASLLIISISSFAKLPASDALLKVIPEGLYDGKTDNQSPCQVEVKYALGFYQSFTQITATSAEGSASYRTNNSNDYSIGRLGKQNVLFLQVEMNNDLETSSLRIVNSNINKINVSVGNYEYNGNDRIATEVSCNI
jgi:hypothetical protein